MKPTRNPDSAPGDWYIDTACKDLGVEGGARHEYVAAKITKNN
jgi:hypothetical protein